MHSRFRLFAFAVLMLLIKVSPALSQNISFNKVSLPDETFPKEGEGSSFIILLTTDI